MDGQGTVVTPSFCVECYNHCPVIVHVDNGTIVRVEGNSLTPYTQGRLCPKGQAALMRLYDPNRLRVPMKRTNPDKGIGVDPRWQEITWEEALETIAGRMAQLRATNPRGLKVPTREHPRVAMAQCWGLAFGTHYVGSGAGTGGGVQCGNAAHTLGTQIWGSFHDWPEYRYTRYALFIGTNTGFESDRALPMDAKRIADARLQGMKLVVVDLRFTHTAAKADEWIPIRPATDGAFVLGLVNLLVNELGIYDAQFLRQHTNAPYLIGPDGHYVVDPVSGKPLIWDAVANGARPFDVFGGDEVSGRAALEGEYVVNGVPCRPAFQLLKDRVREYTPEKVEQITSVPAATVRRVAREFGESAQIGATIEIEGQRWPLRGSLVAYYRGTQGHVHSTLTTQAIYTLQMMVGAMGVPGGTMRLPTGTRIPSAPLRARPDGTVAYDLTQHVPFAPPVWPPTEYHLGNYLPFDVVGASHLHYVTGAGPDKWGLDSNVMVFADNSNPVLVVGDQKVMDAYHQNAFVVVMDQYLTETAELADIVLPSDFQLERHSVVAVKAGASYLGFVYSRPAVKRPYQARDWWEVALELAERVGFLYGEGGFNYWVNATFRLRPEYALSLNERPDSFQVQERIVKNIIGEEGWQKLVTEGLYAYRVPAAEKYLPYRGARLAFYNEALLKTGQDLVRGMKESGAYDKVATALDLSDYDALPKWKPGPIHHEDPKYDLFAVNGKSVLFTFGRSAFNAWLMELAERDPYVLKVWVHRDTARRKGIQDGQAIWVESKTARVRGEAKVTQGMHPECVGIVGCLGHWCDHPIAGGKGVHFNSLIDLSLQNTDPICATMQGSAVRVKIYPDAR
ncbi:MAG: molybdopterin-dependent oxidoreductase [Chloroflexi bacterium]|nr:molybdopterin-dependent oxidoreductase [Chloroflexota bacterium]